MLESAINENPDVPGFVQRFGPPFPVGTTENMKSLEFMQLSPMRRNFVPFLTLIDREGNIRFEHTGAEQEYFTEDLPKQSNNIRLEAAQLMNEPVKTAKPVRRRSGAKKSGT